MGRLRNVRPMLVLSLGLHALLLTAVWLVPARSKDTSRPEPIDIVFFAAEPVEPEPVAPPPTPRVKPELKTIARVEPKPAELPPSANPPPRPPTVQAAVIPEVRRPRVAEKPAPRPRVTHTAAFAPAPAEREPRRQATRTINRVAAFATPVEQDRPANPNARITAAGRFDRQETGVRVERSAMRRVSAGAFGKPTDTPRPQPVASGASVKRGGFGDGERKTRPTARRTMAKPDSPVEIVSKPRPNYTHQARELGIEGEVVLQVTFVATGQLRVLRVVDGLGHGLDEAAVEAASKIQFTPAKRAGMPVDYTATLRVVFRLA